MQEYLCRNIYAGFESSFAGFESSFHRHGQRSHFKCTSDVVILTPELNVRDDGKMPDIPRTAPVAICFIQDSYRRLRMETQYLLAFIYLC